MRRLTVTIPGIPVPQGSKRHVGNGVMIEANRRLAPWRADAIAAIQQAMGAGWTPLDVPVSMDVEFLFPRPKSHYGRRNGAAYLKATAPGYKPSAPDLDKLLRATCDALTQAGAWRDDALLADVIACKQYDDGPPRTLLTLAPLEAA